MGHYADWLTRIAPGAPDLARTTQALSHLFDETPPELLLSLDVAARGQSQWPGGGWGRLGPEDVAGLTSERSSATVLLAALSMHPNGHTREAATRQLAEADDERHLKWLLIRCSDWVANVRQPAERSVAERLARHPMPEPYRAELIRLLPLIVSEKLMRSTVQTDLLNFVQAKDQRDLLTEAATSSNQATRRRASRILATNAPSVSLLEAQLTVGDVVAASVVTAALLGDEETCVAAAELVLASGQSRLREEGLWHLIQHHPPAMGPIRQSLLDRSYSVRWMAQQAAGKQGIDLAPWYRSMLDENPLGALLGLGDLGGSEDLGIAMQYVESERSRLRAAAIKIVARQAPRDNLGLLLDVAATDARRVTREAMVGLRSLGIVASMPERVWDLLTSETITPTGQRWIFRGLIAHFDRWTKLLMSLRAVTQEDEHIAQLGSDLMGETLDAWNSSATGPATHQLDEIRRLLGEITRPDAPMQRMLGAAEAIATSWR